MSLIDGPVNASIGLTWQHSNGFFIGGGLNWNFNLSGRSDFGVEDNTGDRRAFSSGSGITRACGSTRRRRRRRPSRRRRRRTGRRRSRRSAIRTARWADVHDSRDRERSGRRPAHLSLELRDGHDRQPDGAHHAVDRAGAAGRGALHRDGRRRKGRDGVRHGHPPGGAPGGEGVRVRRRALRLRPLLAAAGGDAGARRGGQGAGEEPDLRLELEGHTCNIGTAEYNLALGERRAQAVRDYLQSRGVGIDRLRTVSYGEERPKHDNAREETRRLNRRAAMVVRLQQR